MARKSRRWSTKVATDRAAFDVAVELRALLILINSYWHPNEVAKVAGVSKILVYKHAEHLISSMTDEDIAGLVSSAPALIAEAEACLSRGGNKT